MCMLLASLNVSGPTLPSSEAIQHSCRCSWCVGAHSSSRLPSHRTHTSNLSGPTLTVTMRGKEGRHSVQLLTAKARWTDEALSILSFLNQWGRPYICCSQTNTAGMDGCFRQEPVETLSNCCQNIFVFGTGWKYATFKLRFSMFPTYPK